MRNRESGEREQEKADCVCRCAGLEVESHTQHANKLSGRNFAMCHSIVFWLSIDCHSALLTINRLMWRRNKWNAQQAYR